MSTGTSCHFGHLLQVYTKCFFEVWFYTSFSWLYTCIQPRGRVSQPTGDKVLMSTEMSYHFIHLLQFKKKSLWSLILYIFFHDLIHVYSPGVGQTVPKGQNFDVNRKALSLYPFVASFKEMTLYNFFHDLIHVNSSGAGGIQPTGDKVLMSAETSCHFCHLLLVSNHRQQ